MIAHDITVAETELVARAKAGDVPAFEELYRRYNARMYNFARQIVGSGDDAQDAVQETFIKAWSALPKLRADETFGTWLHRIALNICRDAARKRGKKHEQSLDSQWVGDDGEPVEIRIASEDPDPAFEAISAETRDAVRKAISLLGDDHRLVVTMHHLSGMDVATIAEVLGVSKGTVMSRLSRAREALRRKLAAYVED